MPSNRDNSRLNYILERKIEQWKGTVFGSALKHMYKNGASYESMCEYADIDYNDEVEE